MWQHAKVPNLLKRLKTFHKLLQEKRVIRWGGRTCLVVGSGNNFTFYVNEQGEYLLFRRVDGEWEIKYADQDDSYWMLQSNIQMVSSFWGRLAILWRASIF